MNIVIFYDKFATFTNTVFDHLRSFSKFSRANFQYCHGGIGVTLQSLNGFDAVVIHYSMRVSFGQVEGEFLDILRKYNGLKILFVQDEYDFTESIRKIIADLDIRLVFTCVPERHIDNVYPAIRFPYTRFVNNLTGYLPLDKDFSAPRRPIKDRLVAISYRGRALPYWYGDLGQEKQIIAQRVREECDRRQVSCDIEWTEQKRIYGARWDEFLTSCKATLGTESGSNVFDDYGEIRQRVKLALERDPNVSYEAVRGEVFGDHAEQVIMNQVSPRIFEAIAAGTGLVLYEGHYSGVIEPYAHYIPLRKDHGNMDEVFALLGDDEGLQAMADRAFAKVIESGEYSYKSFVRKFDAQVSQVLGEHTKNSYQLELAEVYTPEPIRTHDTHARRLLAKAWSVVPEHIRTRFRPMARRVWERVCRQD